MNEDEYVLRIHPVDQQEFNQVTQLPPNGKDDLFWKITRERIDTEYRKHHQSFLNSKTGDYPLETFTGYNIAVVDLPLLSKEPDAPAGYAMNGKGEIIPSGITNQEVQNHIDYLWPWLKPLRRQGFLQKLFDRLN